MKKNLFLLLSLLFSIVMVDFVLADGETPPVMLSGTLEGSNGSVQLMKELNSFYGDNREIELSGKYKLTADVRFKTVKQQALFEQLPLVWREETGQGSPPRVLPSGRFLFSEQRQESIELDLLPDLNSVKDSYRKQQDAILTDYDELWIDYQDIVNDSPTEVNLELIVEPKRIEGSAREDDEGGIDYFVIKTAQDNNLVELASEQIATAIWQAKDQLHLFKRTFGLQADQNWRYLQEDGHVVLQRRFEQQLSKYNSVLDLLLDKQADLERVNLRLSSEDNSDVIVEWETIPKKIEEDQHEQMRVRLFLDELLRNQFTEQEEVFLQELVVFITGNVAGVVNNRPLRSLHWMVHEVVEDEVTIDDVTDDPMPDNIKVITVPVQLEQLGNIKDGKHRLKINLQPINRQVGWNSRIKSAKLFLEPKKSENQSNNTYSLGGVAISKVRLVSLYQNKVPSIAMQGQEQLKSWGINISNVAESSELTKWPTIENYAPVLNSVISSNSQGDRWVDLEWQVDGWLDSNSLLHLGDSSIQEDQVRGVKISPFYNGKSLGNWFLHLNDSIELNGEWQDKQQVDLIKLRVFLKPLSEKMLLERQGKLMQEHPLQEVEFLLNDIALFKVSEFSFAELLNKPLPKWQKRLLQKEFKIPAVGNDNFYFKTVVERENSTEYDFVNLKYTAPWAFPLIEPCWLDVNAIGNGVAGRREEKQQICLDKSSGSEEISIPVWAEQIEWQVILPKLKSNGHLNYWQGKNRDFVKLSLTGNWLKSTINDQILNTPIFTLNGENVLSSQMELKRYGGKLYFDITDLTADDIKTIKHFENPWVEVNRITVEREQPFTLEEWQQINKQQVDVVEGSSIWLKLLSYLIIGLTLWWLVASGWFGKLWRGFISIFLWVWHLPVTILGLFDITVSWKGAFWWWVFVTLSLYIAGILISVTNGENYWFTFGGMAAVLAWRALVWWLQPWLEQQWRDVADKVYGGSGTHYFSGFIVILVGVATMLMFKLEPIAEQLAVIGYYMLVVGTILEMRALRNERDEDVSEVIK